MTIKQATNILEYTPVKVRKGYSASEYAQAIMTVLEVVKNGQRSKNVKKT